MTLQRHEIPTHLNVEDKAFYGLSVRQVMYLTVGAASGYGLWNQWADLPVGLRLVSAVTCFLLAAAVALIRPYGRGFEEWIFVGLHYAAIPKVCTWRACEPDPNTWRRDAAAWEELVPQLAWHLDTHAPDAEVG